MAELTFVPVTPVERRNQKYAYHRHNPKVRERARKTQARYHAEKRYSREQIAARNKHRYDTWKRYAFMWLGGMCERCKNNDMRVLQIDHVNNNGRAERAKLGTQMFKRVLTNTEDYRLLCANCHCIRHAEEEQE